MNTNFRLFPEQASTMAPRVDALFWFIVAVCTFFTILIAVLLIAFAVRYRRRTEDYFPKPIIGSTVLETTWSVIPLVLLLGMFFWGAGIYLDIFTPPRDSHGSVRHGQAMDVAARSTLAASARSTICTSRLAGPSSSS